jgi:transcriptional regulator with XRE-family HTH domain
MDFWMRLKQGIKAQNTTQEWIAGKIGVPFGTFRKWLTRKTYPNVREGVELAKLLETSVEFLVTGTDTAGLSEDERKLMNGFRRLNKNDQKKIILSIEAWLGNRRRQ